MAAQRGFDRVVNLSDAVVAIAATLLVLPLVDSAADIQRMSAVELLAEHWTELFAFALSFTVICRFWLVHHAVYARLEGYSGGLLWANFLWLLSIAFLPFPTELVAFSGIDDPAVSATYIGTMVVSTGAMTLQLLIAVRNPALQTEATRGTLRLAPSLVALGSLVLALVVAVVFPSIGLWAILLMVPAGYVQRAVSERRERAVAAG